AIARSCRRRSPRTGAAGAASVAEAADPAGERPADAAGPLGIAPGRAHVRLERVDQPSGPGCDRLAGGRPGVDVAEQLGEGPVALDRRRGESEFREWEGEVAIAGLDMPALRRPVRRHLRPIEALKPRIHR